jgi:uncharacterized lipoprotein YmbA
MRAPAPLVVLCALAAAWAGCATPRPAHYVLNPVASAAPAAADYAVSVGPVSVPEIVDRPQIVVRTGSHQVFFDEFHRWGSPLKDDIARVVAENLGRLLGTSRVAAYPQPEAPDARYRVRVDVASFESGPGEAAVLDAAWSVTDARDGAVRRGRSRVREEAKEGGYPALAAAHSRALGKVSGDIAAAIRAMEGAATPRSPEPGSAGTDR